MKIFFSGELSGTQIVATGVVGEPTAPGNRKGGAVNKNLERPLLWRALANSERYQISPKWTPKRNKQ